MQGVGGAAAGGYRGGNHRGREEMKSKGDAILEEWPGFRLGLPTFAFHEYIRRCSGVLSLDWFGLWSWKHCLASFGSGSFAE